MERSIEFNLLLEKYIEHEQQQKAIMGDESIMTPPRSPQTDDDDDDDDDPPESCLDLFLRQLESGEVVAL